VKADKLRALGVATAKRVEPAAGRADLRRAGLQRISRSTTGSAWWRRRIHRRKTIAQLSGWFKAALQEPEVKAKLALQGLYPVGQCGEEFASVYPQALVDYGEMIKESNIKAE